MELKRRMPSAAPLAARAAIGERLPSKPHAAFRFGQTWGAKNRRLTLAAGWATDARMHTLEQLRSGALAGARVLRLPKAGLSEFPREIFDLAPTLEVLDLSGNALSALPDDLPRLEKLRVLFCSDTLFTELPPVLGLCPGLTQIGFKAARLRTVPAGALPQDLRWLTLTDNAIEALPPEIGRCHRLQKLMLAGNRLTGLPPELANCTRLELLRLSANRLTERPAWLAGMPRLSWLAMAGNPFNAGLETAVPGAALAWDDLELHAALGEGASGVIHRATRRDGMPMVVKVFKGAMTSDGLPRNEMLACLNAGAHPNLVPVIGRVDGHPEGRDVLAMSLIDPALTPLAGPPSLDSCTRDVYPAGTRFSLDHALHIAMGVAAAARHLHARGLLHGDLYAHNILQAPGRPAMLGDFGGASFYAPGDGPALQRLEVRAFGCLLQELVERCDAAVPEDLTRLVAACLGKVPARRPLFEEIEIRLAAIS